MFDALDESIKNLLIDQIPVKKNEISIVFDQPTDDWAARVSKPTLNVYLYEIRENRQLRGAEQFKEIRLTDGNVEVHANPSRVDLFYLITAWSKKEQDQHHLLGLAMMALLRSPFMPKKVYADGLNGHSVPIRLSMSHSAEDTKNWSDFWSTMNNKVRPGLMLKATLLLDPYEPVISTMVSAAEIAILQDDPMYPDPVVSRRYYVIGGEIKSEKYDPSVLSLTWEEKDRVIKMEEEGRFRINKVPEGAYHLAIRFNDRLIKRHKFTVPSKEALIIEI